MIRKGILFIISSPSGVGKTTIANFLVANDQNVKRSISFTTRKPRKNEQHGIDYFFVEEEEFEKLEKNCKMLESALVLQNKYGTSSDYIEETLNAGTDVLCCIDWQGAKQIKEKMRSISIFLLPPSTEELRERLIKRGTESQDVIEYRLREALKEMQQFRLYDYVIVNDVLHEAQNKLLAVVQAEREKLAHNVLYVSDFVTRLTSK